MKSVCLFSDGSCLGNPGPGGWAFILRYNGYEKISSGSEIETTNNKMELTAIINGLKALKEPCEVEIFTDSSYAANGINLWLDGWVKKGFKNVKNPELWQEFLKISAKHKISANWVKAHAGHKENEICDSLARKEAQKIKDKI